MFIDAALEYGKSNTAWTWMPGFSIVKVEVIRVSKRMATVESKHCIRWVNIGQLFQTKQQAVVYFKNLS